jgi:hypothetical protein
MASNQISPTEEQARTITVDLYPQEFWVLDQAARITGIRSRTATIRHIINDWARRNLVAEQPVAEPVPMFTGGDGEARV